MSVREKRVKLVSGESWGGLMEEVLVPWLENETGVRGDREWAGMVLVPRFGWRELVKAEAARRNMSLLGVRVLTPGMFRKELLDRMGWLGRVMDLGDDLLVSAGLVRDAGLFGDCSAGFLEGLCMRVRKWEAAGVEGKEIEDEEVRRFYLARRRFELDQGVLFPGMVDWKLFKEYGEGGEWVERGVVFGFGEGDWRWWPLLRLCLRVCVDGTVCGLLPSEDRGKDGMVWLGSWEQECGGSFEPVGAECGEDSKELRRDYLACGSTTAQAKAAVGWALDYLLRASGTERVGIAVPEGSYLGRLVANGLDELGIAYCDLLGRMGKISSDAPFISGWVEWQRTCSVADCLELMRVVGGHGKRERLLRRVSDAIRSEDSRWVARELEGSKEWVGERNEEMLEMVKPLPEVATMVEFLKATAISWRVWGMDKGGQWERFANECKWMEGLKLGKDVYLRWLRGLLMKGSRSRSAMGGNEYARIVLLSHGDALCQRWSGLVVCGLNEDEAEGRELFWGAAERALWQKWNSDVVVQGAHGDGHWSVREGAALWAGEDTKNGLRRICLKQLIDYAGSELALCWAAHDDEDATLPRMPDSVVVGSWKKWTGSAFSQDALEKCLGSGRFYEKAVTKGYAKEEVVDEELSMEHVGQRWDVARPFGVYDFCLAKPPNEVCANGASEMERMLKEPAMVWMKQYLGVSPMEGDSLMERWKLLLGIQVHGWLAELFKGEASEKWVQVEGGKERMLARLDEMVKPCLEEAMRVRATSPVPFGFVIEARLLTEKLLANLFDGEVVPYAYVCSEWSMGEAVEIELDEESKLWIKGRLDIITAQQPLEKDGGNQTDVRAYDFKTGKVEPLTTVQFRKGNGLQFVLYAMALKKLTEGDVEFVALTVESDEKRVVREADFSDAQSALRTLARMQATGRFGQWLQVREGDRAMGAMPLATLPIPEDVLLARCKLTYPELWS